MRSIEDMTTGSGESNRTMPANLMDMLRYGRIINFGACYDEKAGLLNLASGIQMAVDPEEIRSPKYQGIALDFVHSMLVDMGKAAGRDAESVVEEFVDGLFRQQQS